MQKHIRLALVLLICSFIAFPLIPTNAIKTLTQQSNAPENTLSIKTYTTSNSIKVDVSFPRPTIIPSQNYQTVKMQDLPRYGDPGAPVLPLKTIKILIPQGKKYQSIDVVPGNRTTEKCSQVNSKWSMEEHLHLFLQKL